jgi:predicted nucleic acid-binding protein
MMNDSDAVRRAKKLTEESIPIVIGTPTVFELYVGVGLSVKNSEEREKIQNILKSLTHLPLDVQSATRAGLIYAQKVKEGSRIDPEDAMLAGIAIESQQPILTRNRKDFLGIPELKVESY